MSELDEILAEFESLDENYQTKEVYAHFGAAMYYAQTLEQLLSNMIVFSKIDDGTPKMQEEIDAIFNEYEPSQSNKRTLGKLINEIKVAYSLDTDEENELARLLKARNFLIHDYFKLNIGFFMYKDGMINMIKDFHNFKNSVEIMNSKLEDKYATHLKNLSLTKEQIHQLEGEIVQSCRNNASTFTL
jgi:hypothetical protein